MVLLQELWQKIIEYFVNNRAQYLLALKEHILISIMALVVAGIIGVLFGYWSVKNIRYEKWINSLFQILRIIPSLAVLILLIPIMGTGIRPAMTALILLALPPILMNTVTGFKSVPPFMLETAEGLGMTEKQMLWKVKVPQALPYILTGIKIATVEIIASATLAAYIGGGGLGTIIFTGLGLNRTDLLIIGGVSVGMISILAGILFTLMERRLFRYKY